MTSDTLTQIKKIAENTREIINAVSKKTKKQFYKDLETNISSEEGLISGVYRDKESCCSIGTFSKYQNFPTFHICSYLMESYDVSSIDLDDILTINDKYDYETEISRKRRMLDFCKHTLRKIELEK